MTSSPVGKDFDSLFPPLGLVAATPASKLGISGLRNPNSLGDDISLHCGSVPILRHAFSFEIKGGTDSLAPVVSNSSGRMNLFDFLESVTVSHNEHLEIQENDTPTVKQIKGLNKEVRALRSELDEKDKLIESQQTVVPDAIPYKAPVVPKNKVWVVKSGVETAVPTAGPELPNASLKVLRCSNPFSVLQPQDAPVAALDPPTEVLATEITELNIGLEDVDKGKNMNATADPDVPSSSNIGVPP
ncbi:hypothetical protein RHGRI_013399 [Rhododendron griersonianum]|uniref:Uncharacterized protein n=1 Tax=Rhododendron griersonianum TaxID=479676 RepID=A0AAV6K5N0_9ERIC|nr:hypothetical protein RHGRI_013399 [Rhododendron griersonianum]